MLDNATMSAFTISPIAILHSGDTNLGAFIRMVDAP